MTGIAGSGKTTLINRLSGSTTEGDHDLQHVGQLQSTPCSLGDYDIVLWEIPDLILDSSSHDLFSAHLQSYFECISVNVSDCKGIHLCLLDGKAYSLVEFTKFCQCLNFCLEQCSPWDVYVVLAELENII